MPDNAAAPVPSLWRQHDYRCLWGGMVVSTLGSAAAGIVYPLLVLALTGSATLVGLITALRTVPYLLLSLPVGALVDRWDRRRVMLRAELTCGCAVASLPLAMAFGPPTMLHIGAVALVEGIAVVFYNLAEVAALPRAVTREQLPHATAANHAGHSAASVAGPALGTWLYQSLWRGMPFVADALSYAASAWMLLRLRADFAPRGPLPERRDLRAEVAEGLRWLWHQRLVRLIALLTSGINFVHASMPILLIVIAKQQGASEVAIGLVFSIGGIGGMLGALVGPWARRRFSFGQAVIGATLVQALLFPLFSLAPGTLWLGAIYAAIMFFAPIYNVVQLSYRVALIPDGLQGRVNSGFRFTAHLLYPVGAALCGVLIEHAGAMPALALFAACYLALAGAALASREIRQAG